LQILFVNLNHEIPFKRVFITKARTWNKVSMFNFSLLKFFDNTFFSVRLTVLQHVAQRRRSRKTGLGSSGSWDFSAASRLLSVSNHTANNFGLMYSRKRISQNSFPSFIYIIPNSFMVFCLELNNPKRNYENQIWT